MPALTPATLKDLERSGLTEATIESSGIQDGKSDETIGALLRDTYHVQGFVLPYFGVDRQPLKFYRVKVLESLNGAKPTKYLQPKGAGNHLYVPPLLHELSADWSKDTDLPLFITEGEKKALAGVQAGLHTIAVSGVFSWRTHIHTLKREAVRVVEKSSSRVVILDDHGEKAYRMEVTPELEQIDWNSRQVILLFDSDAASNPEVQRAAFELSNWLADRGAEPIQISLADRIPSIGGKAGLDDILAAAPSFGDRLKEPEWRAAEGFRPLPSDPLSWVADQLNTGRGVNRETQERVSTFAINWLDANGTRFMGEDGTYYYFDSETRILHDFVLERGGITAVRETSFGHLLVEQLSLDPVDSSTMGRLIGRFPLGAPTISPSRVLAQSPDHPDTIYYQLTDADVMRVTPYGLDLISNGDDDVLFYQKSVEPLDPDTLVAAVEAWHRPEVPLWYQALSTLNIAPLEGLTREETLRLLTTMYYISPWLNRWRGLMLPLEIAVGEPNSGKSFLHNLRKGLLTGRPALAGLPDDFKAWVASIGAAPALWVCDNLGNVKSEYWHRLNDELARLITDPDPSIELRKLYTTATTFNVPVSATFAITTIRNPFSAPDVLQRSLVYNLSAIPVGQRDPDWYTERLGNRTQWVAEHLNAIHQFLRRASKKWQPNYKSGYRLVHFEQSVMMMGAVFGWDMTKVVKTLPEIVAATVAAYDPVMEAFATFVDERADKPRRRIRLREVVEWVENDPGERFTALRQFANEITLSKYVFSHKYDIEQATGVEIVKEPHSVIFILPGDK